MHQLHAAAPPAASGATSSALAGRIVPGALVLALLAGCRTSGAGREGSLDELGRLVGESGAEPVLGTEVDGLELTPDDPLGLDEEALSELWEEEQGLPPFEYPENPYIRFGERIVVKALEDGRQLITKPFPMPPGKAQRIVDLIGALDPFPIVARDPALPPGHLLQPAAAEGAPAALVLLAPGAVQYLILENWDQAYYANLDAAVPTAANPVNVSDMLVVTAAADELADFEAFLDLFSAGVPQIELEAKIIELVETDTLDVGVDATALFGTENFVKSFGFNLPNATEAVEAVLSLGAVQDGTTFDALIEAIRSWQNVTIETRPKTVVRAGGLARLESTVEIPYADIKNINESGGVQSGVAYKSAGVKLYITPRVVGSTALALDVQLENSQVVSFQTVFTQSNATPSNPDLPPTVISVPAIASRTARTIVYLEPGQTLLIGGLTQETNQEAVDKVPILGDLPILGFLFRSTFTETRREHVIFAISPRVIQRGDLRAEL